MSTAPHRLSSLSFEERLALEPLLLAFDQAWHERLLEQQVAQLPPPGHPHRCRGLLELIKIDLEQQRKRGRQAKIEAYLHFYPELGSAETVPAELLLAEYQVRRQFGETVELADFARRFPRQAEALRRLLEGASVPPSLAPSPSGDTVNEVSRRSSASGTGRTSESLPEQFGPYRILKKLGEGGMGAVYLVHNTALERQEALKVSRLPEELSRRFFVEAQAAARTNHPNICQVYVFGEIDGVRFLTMECVAGGTLADLVSPSPTVPPERAAALVRSLALALEKAHEQKVYHRDLKPANVLLTKDGEPKITDFGLACLADGSRHTASGTIMGTPYYMAPEQARGEVNSLDHACDIYSLGIILYELLTGRVPFLGQGLAVLNQHISAQPQPPSSLHRGLDPRLDAICLKALAKVPAERHASMGAFAEALSDFLRGESLDSTSQRGIEPVAALSQPSVVADSRTGSRAGIATSPSSIQPAHQKRIPRWAILAGTASLMTAFVVAVVFMLRTEYGTIRIEVDDPKVTVEIDGEEVTIRELGESIKLRAGKHGLIVKRGDMVIEARAFKIERGKNQPLKVQLSPSPVQWVELVNGKDLTGWKTWAGDNGGWQIVNQHLVGSGDVKPLFSELGDLEDFKMRAEVQINDKGAAGIFFRAPFVPHALAAYHVPINVTHTDAHKTRSLSDLGLNPKRLHEPGEWVVLELTVKGTQIVIEVNGTETVNLNDLRFRKGHLALVTHTPASVVRFRSLKVMKVPEKPQIK